MFVFPLLLNLDVSSNYISYIDHLNKCNTSSRGDSTYFSWGPFDPFAKFMREASSECKLGLLSTPQLEIPKKHVYDDLDLTHQHENRKTINGLGQERHEVDI